MNDKKRITLLMGLLTEHLNVPDNQKIAEWEDLAKRTRDALAWTPPKTAIGYLEEYEPALYVDIKKMMEETKWGLHDCWDKLDPHGYHEYCESE